MKLSFESNLLFQLDFIPTERTPGANGGICCWLIKIDVNLLDGQIPPLRNSSYRSRFASRKDKKNGWCHSDFEILREWI